MLLAALKNKSLHIICATLVAFLFSFYSSHAQTFRLKGVVYDSARVYPLQAVSVLKSSGSGTMTDANGRYELEVSESDSVWFSYLNKPTVKYAVAKIFDSQRFDVALHIHIPVLKEIVLRPKNYRFDSLQNRLDYAKAFNWEKPMLKPNINPGQYGTAVGFDLQEIIRMFQFRKNKSMELFQERLLQQEREKFIDYRFNKALVLRLSGLTGAARDRFMVRTRPTYEFCIAVNDYDFHSYIKFCFEKYGVE